MPSHKTKTDRTHFDSPDSYDSVGSRRAKRSKYSLAHIRMGDVEDPELFAAEPLINWENSEQGQWCKKHAHDLAWNLSHDPVGFGYLIIITGEMYERDYTLFLLKYGRPN